MGIGSCCVEDTSDQDSYFGANSSSDSSDSFVSPTREPVEDLRKQGDSTSRQQTRIAKMRDGERHFSDYHHQQDAYFDHHSFQETPSGIIQIYGPNSLIYQGQGESDDDVLEGSYMNYHHQGGSAGSQYTHKQNYSRGGQERVYCNCCGGCNVSPPAPPAPPCQQSQSPCWIDSRVSCQCDNARVHHQYCCICQNMREVQDDSSDCQQEFVDLPYQHTDAYQQLLQELEVTINRRNREKQQREMEPAPPEWCPSRARGDICYHEKKEYKDYTRKKIQNGTHADKFYCTR